MVDSDYSLKSYLSISAVLLLATIVANLIIYFLGSAMGVFNESVTTPQGDAPIEASVVIMSTTIFLVLGFVGFYVLTKFLNMDISRVRLIAIIVVVLTFAMPFTAGASMMLVIFLELMHIAAGVIVIWGLTTDTLWDRFS